MKNLLFLILPACLAACAPGGKKAEQKSPVVKSWLGGELDFHHIVEGQNRYHMFDSVGGLVGQMDFVTSFENGSLIIRDTSQFFDGSVYETANFVFDTTEVKALLFDVDMSFGSTKMTVDLNLDSGKLKGEFYIEQNSAERNIPIDSALTYDISRIELYALLQALNISEGDSIEFTAFVPLSFAVSRANIKVLGDEIVEVPAGSFNCTKIRLRTDGKMPDNDIWITKEEPRKIVKFYIPNRKLEIKLI